MHVLKAFCFYFYFFWGFFFWNLAAPGWCWYEKYDFILFFWGGVDECGGGLFWDLNLVVCMDIVQSCIK